MHTFYGAEVKEEGVTASVRLRFPFIALCQSWSLEIWCRCATDPGCPIVNLFCTLYSSFPSLPFFRPTVHLQTYQVARTWFGDLANVWSYSWACRKCFWSHRSSLRWSSMCCTPELWAAVYAMLDEWEECHSRQHSLFGYGRSVMTWESSIWVLSFGRAPTRSCRVSWCATVPLFLCVATGGLTLVLQCAEWHLSGPVWAAGLQHVRKELWSLLLCGLACKNFILVCRIFESRWQEEDSEWCGYVSNRKAWASNGEAWLSIMWPREGELKPLFFLATLPGGNTEWLILHGGPVVTLYPQRWGQVKTLLFNTLLHSRF